MIVNMNEWKQERLNQDVTEHCREFQVYYEYCLVDSYEDKFEKFRVDAIQLGDVFAGILESHGKHFLVSIQFFKDKFTLSSVEKWIADMAVFFDDEPLSTVQIPNCSKVIDRVRFNGCPIVSYQKGHEVVDAEMTDAIEVNDIYENHDCIVNPTDAYDVDPAEEVEPCKVPICLNGEQVVQVPEMTFDISNGDLIVCNGMIVVADMMENYCGTVGFTQTDNAALPVAFFHDDDTPIYIDVTTRDDGSRICSVRQDSRQYEE